MKSYRIHNGTTNTSLRNGILFAALITVMASAALLGILAGRADASHAWGGYHWARKSNPFTLKLGDNLTSNWKPFLQTTSNDWSQSDVLDTVVVTGTKNPKTCKATLGQVEVCNAKYGKNGWLGLAQIWLNSSGHIVQGTTKVNDSYFASAPYNTPAEKNHVMCQEVGHNFGLGHQDESGADLGTCMDYSMSLNSQHPNDHDYWQLEQIYVHLDSTSTVGAVASGASAVQDPSDKNNSQNWGRRVFRSKEGYVEHYVREYQDGSQLVSAVYLLHHEHEHDHEE